MEEKRRPIWPMAVATPLLAIFLYAASYPIVLRLERPRRITYSPIHNTSLYVPVEWLIDNTPLSTPLFWWGEFFGVELEMMLASEKRMGNI